MKLILMMVQSADGITTKHPNQKVNWSSPEDKKAFMQETKKHSVIIMGRTTYDTIGRHLPHRLNIILTRHPEQYKERTIPGTLEFYNFSPSEVVAYLEKKGVTTAVLAGGPKTNAEFLKVGLVDELLLTVEPVLFGQGLTLALGHNLNISMELIETKHLNQNTIQLRYRIQK